MFKILDAMVGPDNIFEGVSDVALIVITSIAAAIAIAAIVLIIIFAVRKHNR